MRMIMIKMKMITIIAQVKTIKGMIRKAMHYLLILLKKAMNKISNWLNQTTIFIINRINRKEVANEQDYYVSDNYRSDEDILSPTKAESKSVGGSISVLKSRSKRRARKMANK